MKFRWPHFARWKPLAHAVHHTCPCHWFWLRRMFWSLKPYWTTPFCAKCRAVIIHIHIHIININWSWARRLRAAFSACPLSPLFSFSDIYIYKVRRMRNRKCWHPGGSLALPPKYMVWVSHWSHRKPNHDHCCGLLWLNIFSFFFVLSFGSFFLFSLRSLCVSGLPNVYWQNQLR